MRDVLQFLVELILALTGTIGTAALVVGGIVFAIGCALCGCGWLWRRRRGRGRPVQ
jgi:hypothetical protein